MKRIVLIGSGNVATHLGHALVKSGAEVIQVWSRTYANAEILAKELGAIPTSDLSEIVNNADAYIFSVKDDALPSVLKSFPHRDKVLLHTAGSLPVDILEPYSEKYGVLYPLQTFSKATALDFKAIPLLLEASDDKLMSDLKVLANGLSSQVTMASSRQRKFLHVAAVLACNFTNHLYALAEGVLVENDLTFDLIRPLILQTAQKAMHHSPSTVQTGPAVRKDEAIVNSHLEMLANNEELQHLYALLSQSIMKQGDRI